MIINIEYVLFFIDVEIGDIIAFIFLDRDMGFLEYIILKVWVLDFGIFFRREIEIYVYIRIKVWNDNFFVFEYFSCDLIVV